MGKRRFGAIRQLPSGRWQARYPDPDSGELRPAPHTFERKKDAESWLAEAETDMRRGDWLDPASGDLPFAEFAKAWVEERANLRPKTVQLYEYLLQRHLLPTFGNRTVGEIKEAHVRRWRKERLDADVSAVTVAKSYRLLKTILNTAVDDGLIRRNPCRIKGAGQEYSSERPVLTPRQVYVLAEAVGQRYRALVLLATFASLRWGEAAALRRCDIDLQMGTVRVDRQLTELQGGAQVFGPPKSQAGRRLISVPEVIAPELARHLERFGQSGSDGLVFVSPQGRPLRRTSFRRVWKKATEAAGVPGVHFHDLRHTGNTLAAASGASLRELMQRMGHASARAALIYQHATRERDRAIADALNVVAQQASAEPAHESQEADQEGSGTQVAREDGQAS